MDVDRLVGIIQAHGYQVREAGTRQLVMRCPLCSDYKERLYISQDHGAWLCFNCDNRGSLVTFFSTVLNLDRGVAYALAQKVWDKQGPQSRPIVTTKPKKPLKEVQPPPLFRSIAKDWKLGVAQPYREYLERRGVDRETAEAYQMGYVILGDYAGRIIIPIVLDGVVVSWIARSIYEKAEPKVLTAPGTSLSGVLFNLDNITPPRVVLVEGVFDALKLREVAVATLGARLSWEQIRLLKRRGFDTIIIMPDNDETGWQAAAKHAWTLLPHFEAVYLAPLPPGVKDAGEATEEQLREGLDKMRPITYDLGEDCLEVHHD